MKFHFKAEIYKVGINPCVKVPFGITQKFISEKGYIYIKGKINDYPFQQTLVPVKDEEYRLYVNGPMLKGGKTAPGETARFAIEQDDKPKTKNITMLKEFKKALEKNKLLPEFNKLTPSRQNEILKYLNFLKTEESVQRNIKKVIDQLKLSANG